jgi:hypothetical protein
MPRSAHAERPARSPRLAALTSLALPVALALTGASACSQQALVGLQQDAGTPSYDTAPFDGPGYVNGHLHAHAVFDSVDRVYWFNGDSAKIAVYIFEDAPQCDDVSKDGYWLASQKVRPADVMGITVGGNKPGVYQVVAETPPRAGNAYVLHVIDQADPVIESEGQSGTVTITSVKPGDSVSGAFEATFSTGPLQGGFNALPCPTGVEL